MSAKYCIELTFGATSVFSTPYRAGPKAREVPHDETARMFKLEVIEPATAEWSARIVFAPKQDGTLCFCVNYRKVNTVTQRNLYAFPRMDEWIDSIIEITVFITLEANSGCWKLEIDDEYKEKPVFISHHDLYRLTRISFGLKNAQGTFQQAMDVIQALVKWQTALVYQNDIVIFSKTPEAHIANVKQGLKLLHTTETALKLEKWRFFTDIVEYLGHVIRSRRQLISSRTIDAMKQLKEVRNLAEIRSFLGLYHVFRQFVPNFACIAEPLNWKLQKDQPKEIRALQDKER